MTVRNVFFASIIVRQDRVAMGDVRADLLKGIRIEQPLDPLARGQLSLGVLLLDSRVAAAGDRLRAQLAQSLGGGHHGEDRGARARPAGARSAARR